MDDYTRQMQLRLREKKIGYKKEFLREFLKELRVGKNPRTGDFFILYQMVEPKGIEPSTS